MTPEYGAAICHGRCVVCRQPFAFHPENVPSICIDGLRQPLCQPCVEQANGERGAAGLHHIVPVPGARGAGGASDIK